MNHISTRQLFNLSGRTFLVVGGARTLGYDMALALAEFGADGVATSRIQSSAAEAAGRIAGVTGRAVYGLALDGSDEASVQAGLASALDRMGRIDVLINNVGGGAANAPSLPEDRLDRSARNDITFALRT